MALNTEFGIPNPAEHDEDLNYDFINLPRPREPPSCLFDPRWFEKFNEMNPEIVWQLMRSTISGHLLQSYAITCPYLRDARLYNLGQLIIKYPQNIVDVLAKIDPFYGPIGHFEDFFRYEVTEEEKERLNRFWERPGWSRGVPYFRLAIEHKMYVKGELYKEIDVVFKPYQRWVMSPHFSAESCLDFTKLPAGHKKFYMVVETFYTPRMVMKLTIGKECKFFVYRWLPIGFTLAKFGPIFGPCGELGIPTKFIFAYEFYGRWKTAEQVKEDLEKMPKGKNKQPKPEEDTDFLHPTPVSTSTPILEKRSSKLSSSVPLSGRPISRDPKFWKLKPTEKIQSKMSNSAYGQTEHPPSSNNSTVSNLSFDTEYKIALWRENPLPVQPFDSVWLSTPHGIIPERKGRKLNFNQPKNAFKSDTKK